MFPRLEALFFENPWVHRAPPGKYGIILYLLRRDINSCLGAEAGLRKRSARQIQWPGAMSIFAGIDLLAKFLAGKDGSGVGSRFKAFVKRFFHLSDADAETLYQLRNSMLHSFGLYSRGKCGAVYRFTLVSRAARPLIRKKSHDQYLVDVISLHEDFEKAIKKYRRALQDDSALQQNFTAMFPNYGAIHIV